MSPSPDFPLLRYVEPQAHEHKGQKFLILTDPMGFAEGAYPVTLYGAFLLQMFDGKHAPADMQEEFRRATGRNVPEEDIRGLIKDLDAAGFLVGEAFEARKKKIVDRFRAAPVRPAWSQGAYIPPGGQGPEGIPGYLESFFSHERGPGQAPPPAVKKGAVKAILAPHIDLHRGGPCYAHAYGALAQGCSADTFVVLGVAHKSPGTLYTATKKAYDTPLGAAPVDTEFVDELASRWKGGDLFADEIYHRDEHSIEFQALLLRWLFRDKPFRIVPILVSSMHEHVFKRTDPLADPQIAGFVDALRQTVEKRGKVVMIGAVDLSHVGAKFGDKDPVTPDLLKKIEAEDLASLEHAAAVDPKKWFKSVSDVKDWRKICGLSAITTLLAATDAKKGSLVKYDRFADLENHEVVSYTAMEFR
ncbi:MAG: hypothetical protein FD180_5100 [Planctomycetota bacterium]|nr:MAG: hypothetical protein FD180_5100 [Planctomycetota bacterium]